MMPMISQPSFPESDIFLTEDWRLCEETLVAAFKATQVLADSIIGCLGLIRL